MISQLFSTCKCFGFLFAAVMLFTVFPGLDLWVSNLFYAGQGYFPANDVWSVRGVYQMTPWIGRVIFSSALVVVLLAIFAPSKISRRQWRRSAAIVAVVILGIGLLVHAVLKEGMGRPRPRDIHNFAGSTSYVPVLKASQFCQTNCSFVSGHAAVGYSLMALGMFGVRERRRFWLLTALLLGSAIGFVRIAQGGHFLSDIVFSFLFIWLTHVAIRFCWLYFRLRQLQIPMLTPSRLPQ